MHRLVQTVVFSHLSKDDAIFFLNAVIRLLSCSFPNTWGLTGPHQGHGWQSWETCSEVLPHVQWLIELVKRNKLETNNPEGFAELIFRAGTYLWGKEQPTTALSFFKFGLSLRVDREGPICKPTVQLLGHIALDLAQPRVGLQAYQETLAARLKYSDLNSPVIADIYDSIACAYTEIGQPDEALEALRQCWELQGLGEEQIAESRYPKHSGDIILLARIYYAQGDTEAALELAPKTITIRKGILGNKGPRGNPRYFSRRIYSAQGESRGLARVVAIPAPVNKHSSRRQYNK